VRPRALITAAVAGTMACSAAQTIYLLGLLRAARSYRLPPQSPSPPPAVVLVPAHDEEAVVARCVASLVEGEPHGAHVVVIADNCHDKTAEIAAEAGATVWSRTDPSRPGKGAALEWALARLDEEDHPAEVVLVVDADCVASPNLVAALASTVAAGADAAQCDYVVENAAASPAAGLRYAGFALINSVRPRGKDAVGLSCGLLGTGMALSREALRDVPWCTETLTEDKEYHLRLLMAGKRARFVADASVRSPMPESHDGGVEQQLRWETGNVGLMRSWLPRLVGRAFDDRDGRFAHAAWELLVAPLSLLAAQTMAAGLAAVALRTPRLGRAVIVTGALQVSYVLGGLRFVGAPKEVYVALAEAPRLMIQRLSAYAEIARGRGAAAWGTGHRPGAPDRVGR
jgi:GT2 family glycosyltransferase